MTLVARPPIAPKAKMTRGTGIAACVATLCYQRHSPQTQRTLLLTRIRPNDQTGPETKTTGS